MKQIYLIFILCFCALSLDAQIDRSKKPVAGPAPKINFDSPKTFQLKNGITVMLVEDDKLPRVTVSLSMTRIPQFNGAKLGANDLMESMLSEGTQKKSKAEFDDQIDMMGANLSLNADGGSVTALKADFEKAIELLSEAMMYPAFQEASFDKVKNQTMTALKLGEKDASKIGNRINRLINFGPNHPYGEFLTAEKIATLSLNDVKEAYQKSYMPNNSYLVFVGDIKEKEARRLANKYFGQWKKGVLIEKEVSLPQPQTKTNLYLVDVPTASQSVIFVSNLIDNTRKSPDSYALNVANQILGGGAEGYLFMNLREKNSYTYGAYSGVSVNKYGATFTATASVGNHIVDSAIIETLKEMDRLVNEPADASAIQLVKSKETGRFALSMEDKATIVGFAINIERDGLPKDYYSSYLQKLNLINAQDIQKVAAKYMNTKAMNIIVAGNAAAIAEKLEALGYPMHYLDALGNKIAKPIKSK